MLGYEPADDGGLEAVGRWMGMARLIRAIDFVQLDVVGDLIRLVVVGPRVRICRLLPPVAALIAVARAVEFAVFSDDAAGQLRNRHLFPTPAPIVEPLEEAIAA
jgi:hypothetical protein